MKKKALYNQSFKQLNAVINVLISLNHEYEEDYGIFFTYDYPTLMYKSIFSDIISFLDYLDTLSLKISDENNSNVQAFGIIGIVILFIFFIIEGYKPNEDINIAILIIILITLKKVLMKIILLKKL